MNDLRLDVALIQQHFFLTRQKARFAILNGAVRVNNMVIQKPGAFIKTTDLVEVANDDVNPYVSKSGLKLKKAIETFNLQFLDKVVVDIAVSDGGFTDCAVQFQAKKVFSIGLLNSQLFPLNNAYSAVSALNEASIQTLGLSDIENQFPDFIVADFNTSAIPIIANCSALMNDESALILTIKPQVEVGKEQLGSDGIVKNPKTHEKIIRTIEVEANNHGLALTKITFAPIFELKKNIEYIALFVKKQQIQPIYSLKMIQDAILTQKKLQK